MASILAMKNQDNSSDQHQDTSFAAEFLRPEMSLLETPQVDLEVRAMRLRAIDRMQTLSLSPRKYAKMLLNNEEERNYLELAKGRRTPSQAALSSWRKNQGDIARLSRRAGGTGQKSTIVNWLTTLIMEKLVVDPKASSTSLYSIAKDVGIKYGFTLPHSTTVYRFVTAIKQNGGIAHIMEKIRGSAYYSTYSQTIRKVYDHSNHTWQTDWTYITIKVTERPRKIAVLLTVDCHSGLIMGIDVLDRDPNTNDIIRHLRTCALAAGNKVWGGLPLKLQSDNAKVYHSRAFLATAASLGFEVMKSPPRCPASNGCVERANGLFKRLLKDQFVRVAKERGLYSEKHEKFIGSIDALRNTIEECWMEYCTRSRNTWNKETRLDSWHRGLRCPDDGYSDYADIGRKCLATDDLQVIRGAVCVRGYWFTHERLAYYNKKTIVVRSTLDGEPKYTVAILKGQEVELFRNLASEAEHVERLKKAGSLRKEELFDIHDTLAQNSLATMGEHSKGTARAMMTKPKIQRVDPAVTVIIPDLQTIDFPSAQ